MNSFENNLPATEDIDLGRIFRLILLQSKLMVFIICLGTSVGLAVYLTSDRIYKITSLLQIYSTQQQDVNNNFGSNLFLGGSNTSDIGNIDSLYKSRSNLIEIVKQLNLNLTIEGLSENEKGIIQVFEVSGLSKGEKNNYEIYFLDKEYKITNIDSEKSYTFAYEDLEEADELKVKISKPAKRTPITINLLYQNPEDSFTQHKSKFGVRNLSENSYLFAKNDGLVEIFYLTRNVPKGINILNTANSLFIERNIEIESEKARKAIMFLDGQLRRVEETLNKDKDTLRNFKANNQTVNVGQQITNILDAVKNNELKINEIELELGKALRLYTSSNPIYQDLLRQRETLALQRMQIDQRIKELPVEEQQYIDLFKNVEISEVAYTELVNRKLEYSIREASTLGNIRVVDNAYLGNLVSPQISTVIISLILSSIFALFFVLVRGLYFLPISNPAELEDNKIDLQIFGVVPKLEDKDNADDKDAERHEQCLETAIMNIQNHAPEGNGCTKVLITSATAENGKSYFSREISKKLSSLGKKVLLIDLDWKRGDQAKAFDTQKITLKDFIDAPRNIESFRIKENLYLIPKVTRLDSSFQFIYSEKFSNLLNDLNENFDYIIMDSAPILSVSDTTILLNYSDVSLAVVRHGLTKINELKQLISISEQVGSKFDGAIYNAYERPTSYYGYYGLYGNYAYQYYAKRYLYDNYDYVKNED